MPTGGGILTVRDAKQPFCNIYAFILRPAAFPGGLPSSTIEIMRVRIFMGGTSAAVAEQINDWLENEAGSAQVVKTETAVGPATDRYGPFPCIVITIWYELEADSSDSLNGARNVVALPRSTPTIAL